MIMINRQSHKMELLLKWIPNSNPSHVGIYQLVDMDSEEILIEGSAEIVAGYIEGNGLVSECGWVWVEGGK